MMSSTFGKCWACLAVLGLAACSSAAPPPPEANAQINFSCALPQGNLYNVQAPSATNYGGTVLDGTRDVRVRCSVSHHGTYQISASIISEDLRLSVDSSDVVGQGAEMSFFVGANASSAGSLNSGVSVDSTNTPAPTCKLTVTRSNGDEKYIVKSGSIFAYFSCPTVYDSMNPTRTCGATGYFLFTGCDT
jgi:hypothetical protein